MANQNDFLPFAQTDNGTNLLSQANYVTDTQRAIGNQPGVARSIFINKVLRQTSLVSSQIAQFVSDKLGVDVLDDGNPSSFLTKLNQALNSTPTGQMAPFAGATAPVGWLLCNGAAVSRTGATAFLFATIGTTYGAGDGVNTFLLPNSQGLFLRGAGSQIVGGVTYSTSLGATQRDQISDHAHGQTTNFNSAFFTGSGFQYTNGSTVVANNSINTSLQTGVSGETRPANLAVNYIIKT